MSRTFLRLLFLDLLVRYFEAERQVEDAMTSSLNLLRIDFLEAMVMEPNGSRWIGFEMAPNWEEEIIELFRRQDERTGRRPKTDSVSIDDGDPIL